jgi:hypothetical protein
MSRIKTPTEQRLLAMLGEEIEAYEADGRIADRDVVIRATIKRAEPLPSRWFVGEVSELLYGYYDSVFARRVNAILPHAKRVISEVGEGLATLGQLTLFEFSQYAGRIESAAEKFAAHDQLARELRKLIEARGGDLTDESHHVSDYVGNDEIEDLRRQCEGE